MTDQNDFLRFVLPGMAGSADQKEVSDLDTTTKGGPGSGFFGHVGRPGYVGGSSEKPGLTPSLRSQLPGIAADLAINRNAREMIDRMRAGGFSYRPTSGFREIGQSGYAVSVEGFEAVIKESEMTPRKIIDHWLKIRKAVLANPRMHLGGWYDRENGVFALDCSEVVDNLEEAKRLGRARKQKAIFDFKNGEEIFLNADEGRLAGAAEQKEVNMAKKAKGQTIRVMANLHQANPEDEWKELAAMIKNLTGEEASEADKEAFLAGVKAQDGTAPEENKGDNPTE